MKCSYAMKYFNNDQMWWLQSEEISKSSVPNWSSIRFARIKTRFFVVFVKGWKANTMARCTRTSLISIPDNTADNLMRIEFNLFYIYNGPRKSNGNPTGLGLCFFSFFYPFVHGKLRWSHSTLNNVAWLMLRHIRTHKKLNVKDESPMTLCVISERRCFSIDIKCNEC